MQLLIFYLEEKKAKTWLVSQSTVLLSLDKLMTLLEVIFPIIQWKPEVIFSQKEEI